MRNVIIFSLGGKRCAVEIRWVREIFTLGWVTTVPTAPEVIAGVVNLRGSIVPVLRGPVSSTGGAGRRRVPTPGDPAILFDVEDTRAALAVDRIDEVTTLDAGSTPGALVDRQGVELLLVDPGMVLSAARKQVAEAAAK